MRLRRCETIRGHSGRSTSNPPLACRQRRVPRIFSRLLRLVAGSLCLVAGLLPGAQAPKEPEDVILRAMKDELERSRALRLASLAPSYFIEYALHDGEHVSASATLGALVHARRTRYRLPRIQVRVGNYNFDHTNFVGSDFYSGTRWEVEQFPLDDAYPALRHHFWLATDMAYKAALEAMARKRAVLRNMAPGEPLPDFARAEPLRRIEEARPEGVDLEAWQARLRRLSAVFEAYPQVFSSAVEFQAGRSVHYLLNSEGAAIKQPEAALLVRVRAAAEAPDGMPLRETVVFHAFTAAGLPSELDLERGTRQVAENLTALVRAPLGEAYTGPVLFEGLAGPQILGEILGKQFAVPRRPLSPPARPISFLSSELEGRLGVRILPEWMDVVDDPTQREWRGRPLFGYYHVDLEGVAPAPLVLVEKGVLKNFLLTRQPVKGFVGSNGRARLMGGFGAKTATFGNLFVRAGQSVPEPELRKQLLELCRQRNKPYGIIVRKMDFPTSAALEDLRRLLAASASTGARLVSPPILAYRVYADGREELVRGLRFRNLNTRAFRDILAASDEVHVFDFLDSPAPMALTAGASFLAECSVVAPSILVDDLELERPQEEVTRPPVVPPPPLK